MSVNGKLPHLAASLATWIVLALGAPFTLAAQSAPQSPATYDSLDSLSWLAGTWGDEQTLEHWTDGDGGLMLGVHRDLRDGRASFFEFLRIALTREGGIVYLASPAGRHPPTVFPLTMLEEGRAVFINPDHDFPQRIDYVLEDGDLVVTISMADQSNQRTWRWRRLETVP